MQKIICAEKEPGPPKEAKHHKLDDESSDSEMPYDSSDEKVWVEEEVSGDDDSDGGPGFLDPTRRHSLPGM